jgi:hypothetical protein
MKLFKNACKHELKSMSAIAYMRKSERVFLLEHGHHWKGSAGIAQLRMPVEFYMLG